MRSCIVNTMELKMHEQSVGLLDWKKFIQGLEVSAALWLQQNITVWCDKLFVSIYVYSMSIEIYDNVVYVIHTYTHAQANT